MITFNAVDVETANADRASICQIGIVHVRDGEITDQWHSLVNPEDWFDPLNVKIHRIDEQDVAQSPTLPDLRGELRNRLRGSVLVSHTAFDRIAFERAMTKYGLEQLQVTWLDSAGIVRRAWPDRYGRKGYGLKDVAQDLSISFKHHDALQDARAAAEIVIHACHSAGTDIEGWLQRLQRPIFERHSSSSSIKRHSSSSSIRRGGNLEGPLAGETVLFTGALGIPRRQAADVAAEAGCNVVGAANRRVTILVVGTQDLKRTNGYRKSSKHRKVEQMIEGGAEIKVLSETDFFTLMQLD